MTSYLMLAISFGNPSQLPSPMQDEYGPFAQHFVTTFAPEIFKVYIHQVELFVSGQAWLSKKCQFNIFQFFTEWLVFISWPNCWFHCTSHSSVKPKSTWQLLKPHFETLVSSFVFPQLSFTQAKQELWETDPVDYVRVSVGQSSRFLSFFTNRWSKLSFRWIWKFFFSSVGSDLFSLVSCEQQD